MTLVRLSANPIVVDRYAERLIYFRQEWKSLET